MSRTETVTLAGGCFWCLEAVYEQMRGVTRVQSGYMGGNLPHPTYQQVCTGRTGHAEVVQIDFDPDIVTIRDLLEVFFVIHDPTTRDRQGNDIGTQYRSAIFYHSDAQREAAEQIVHELQAEKAFAGPIVTQVLPAAEFWPAEDYHNEYFRRNPEQPYCSFVVAPKVAKFKKKFTEMLKPA
ncbi:MAG TPA: peptide-methionine (S)-S-oxide reductase MsrA [Bryobacteraceae bacterium]|nr:peptide-methionine (S)-S-oxide reductase MsrA [Bryobacteraceae bacterium]